MSKKCDMSDYNYNMYSFSNLTFENAECHVLLYRLLTTFVTFPVCSFNSASGQRSAPSAQQLLHSVDVSLVCAPFYSEDKQSSSSYITILMTIMSSWWERLCTVYSFSGSWILPRRQNFFPAQRHETVCAGNIEPAFDSSRSLPRGTYGQYTLLTLDDTEFR